MMPFDRAIKIASGASGPPPRREAFSSVKAHLDDKVGADIAEHILEIVRFDIRRKLDCVLGNRSCCREGCTLTISSIRTSWKHLNAMS